MRLEKEETAEFQHVHLWWIHVNVWQNQYSIVKQNKVKNKNLKWVGAGGEG